MEVSKRRMMDGLLQERDGKWDHSESWGPTEEGQSGAFQGRTRDGWVQEALLLSIIVF